MRELTLPIIYSEYSSDDILPDQDSQLIRKARKAAQNGYAPYSGYQVGAAVLLTNGIIIQGNNQENAAYPSGLCAERVALFYAASQFPGIAVEAIAVTIHNNNSGNPAKPCGACRQVLAEYEDLSGQPIRIILDSAEKIIVLPGIDSLLPLRFKKDDLQK